MLLLLFRPQGTEELDFSKPSILLQRFEQANAGCRVAVADWHDIENEDEDDGEE